MGKAQIRLGIDVGGTKVAAGWVDDTGRLLGWSRIPAEPDLDPMAMTRRIVDQAAELMARHGVEPEQVHQVGLGIPGDFVEPSGLLRGCPNLPSFIGHRPTELLREIWRERWGAPPPIHADNDTVVAVLAEARFGAGRGATRLIYLTVSTGVGGARFDGVRATNLEPGMRLRPDPERPELLLEDLAGGARLARRVGRVLRGWLEAEGREGIDRRTRLFADDPRPTEELGHEIERLTARRLGLAAQKGDRFCQQAFEKAAAWVGRGLALLLAQGFGEERVVVGGSIAVNVPGYLDRVRTSLAAELGPSHPAADFDPRTQLVAAGLGEERGIFGAALLGQDRLCGESPRKEI